MTQGGTDVLTRLVARDFLLPPTGGSIFACWTPPEQRLEFTVAYKIEEPVPPRGLVCTFELSSPVPPEALVGTGIYVSNSIGPYAYIATPQADGRHRFSIKIPAGVDLLQFGIRRWDSAGQTLIRSLTVAHQSDE